MYIYKVVYYPVFLIEDEYLHLDLEHTSPLT